jgi:hypothetical protein
VVSPHAEAVGGDEHRGEDEAAIAEDGLAREDGDDFGHYPEEGQDQDVDLGVSEEPEEVLPQDRVSAGEELGAHSPIQEEHCQRRG